MTKLIIPTVIIALLFLWIGRGVTQTIEVPKSAFDAAERHLADWKEIAVEAPATPDGYP